MTPQDKRRIMREDAARRQARELEELLALTSRASHGTIFNDASDAYVNPELVRGIGMVSPPLRPRGAERWLNSTGTAKVGNHTIGTVDNLPVPSVRVTHANGDTAVVPVPHYRKARASHGKASTVVAANHKLNSADLAPIGDSNH